jgi:hypothetical protein
MVRQSLLTGTKGKEKSEALVCLYVYVCLVVRLE